MKIIELNEITDYIHLRQNSWHIVNDGISCFINPYVDKVTYKNQTINTSKIHDAFKFIHMMFRNADLRIDSFFGNIYPSKNGNGIVHFVQLVPELLWILNWEITIKTNGNSFERFLH